ncbi:UNVERIFIED_CONTAM: hypothetical protein H355_016420 [Colinus virginianus]|nr:hypothetical protein H355_016420 [Colinus virginianus]
MLDAVRSIPTQMDYKGQKLAEQIFQGIILVSAIIGFIYGYVTEQFGWTVYIVMAGFALSCLVSVFSCFHYPLFNLKRQLNERAASTAKYLPCDLGNSAYLYFL